jgi:hypothetical protein
MQQQRAPVMDAKTQRRWDERVRAHIAAQTTEFSEEQRGVLVQLIVAHRAEWRSAEKNCEKKLVHWRRRRNFPKRRGWQVHRDQR